MQPDGVIPFLDRDTVVANPAQLSLDLGELVVVGGEKRARTLIAGAMQVLDDRPCNAEPVIGGSSPAYFVENDETPVGGVVKDVRRFVHFHHEGGIAL